MIRNRQMAGELVEDEMINTLVGLRANKKDVKNLGCCIDGYPKTSAQIRFMKDVLNIEPSWIFILETSERAILANSRNKLFDPLTGTKSEERIVIGSQLEIAHRLTEVPNETPEAIRKRLETWDDTKRLLMKAYPDQIISIDMQSLNIQQATEKISSLMKMLTF